MNDEKKLSIEGLISSGSDLNDASVRLNEVCTEMYKYVTALRESETFKTVVASTEYFGNIDELNGIVPKYSEAILRFSKFLTEYVMQNYTETDEETKSKIEANLASSIEQLQTLGAINSQGLDYTKISNTAANANQGNFISEDKILKQYFEDGELQYITREDGSIQIVKDGIGGASTQTTTSEDSTSSLALGTVATGVLGATAEGTTVASTTSTPAPSDTTTTTESSGITTEFATRGYTGDIHTKSQAKAGVKKSTGNITTNNQRYTIVPDSEYTKAPGTISESDYNLLVAQVAGESGNSKDDMLGVTCTVLNRLEADGYGNSVSEVLEKGYFPWGETHLAYEPGGKYYNTDWGQAKLAQATEAVNDALGGVRNLEGNVYYYSGNGEYNRFSDVL